MLCSVLSSASLFLDNVRGGCFFAGSCCTLLLPLLLSSSPPLECSVEQACYAVEPATNASATTSWTSKRATVSRLLRLSADNSLHRRGREELDLALPPCLLRAARKRASRRPVTRRVGFLSFLAFPPDTCNQWLWKFSCPLSALRGSSSRSRLHSLFVSGGWARRHADY